MSPGEVIAPVHHIEHGEGEGKENPGEDIYLLGLKLEVSHPVGYKVSPPHRYPVVMEESRWGNHVRSLNSPHQRILSQNTKM